MRSDFAALILTHGRPDSVDTYTTLRRQGYTGPIVIVIDNEDSAGEEYRELFSELPGVQVVCFDKLAVSRTFDGGDNQQDRRTIVYARNASYGIARDLGYRYFVQLDDDYYQFIWRFTADLEFANVRHFSSGESGFRIRDLDRVFELFVQFLEGAPVVRTIAMAQGGDFIGGPLGAHGSVLKLRRKAMNSFVCDVERPVRFVGRINEDVNTYTWRASQGEVFLSYNFVSLNQHQTQQNEGGMSDVYLGLGTYAKSMYSVMWHPSSVCVRMMQSRYNPRLHHSINWPRTTPMILSERHRRS